MSKSDEIELIRALADVLNDTGLSEIEIEKDSIKLRVAKQTNIANVAMAAPAIQAAQPVEQAAAPSTPAPADAVNASNHPGAVKSPMVGTAYMAASPDADDYVSVGDNVKEGQTLMIVEAMKTMNEIKAPHSGKITEILAKNGEPVEFDEALMIIG